MPSGQKVPCKASGCLRSSSGKRSIILQFFAWAVAEAVDHPIGIVANVFHAVAGTANFRAAARVEARWVDDGGVAFAAGVESVTAKGISIFLHVLIGGAVAGFASDAQFGDFGLKDVALWVLERFASGGVATDATAVPNLDHARRLGVFEESIFARHPTLIFKKVNEWEDELLIAVIARDPARLHVMRAGEHVDAFPDFGALFGFDGRDF